MKKYVYSAKNDSGNLINGSLWANSCREAAELLRVQNIFVLSLSEETSHIKRYFTALSLFNSSLNLIAVTSLCRQLSIMLKSGITLQDALENIEQQNKNKTTKNILSAVCLQMQTGKTFSDSLLPYEKFFPPTFLTLVTIGETSGQLAEMLQKAAVYLEQTYSAREKLKTAAIYPLILISVFLTTAIIMFMVILPMFIELFNNLNISLPLVTKIVLYLGLTIKNYGLLMTLFTILTFLCCKILYESSPRRQNIFHLLIFKIPLLGRLLLNITLLQLCSALSIMIASGITIDKALSIITDNTPNICFRQILNKAQLGIQKGHSLSAALSGSDLIPPLFMQMLTIGEKSGNLAQLMNDTAEFYQNDTDLLYKRIIALAEPCMIIIISIFIGIFVAAIALPMFEAASQIPM
ncbi:type II secretion system F family protein [Pectinatus frisingensis]|jgi:type IV pilus assembly protein PilC|uniref:type II secretion system F family protein n=1 Tax=Pectinatus frisingensis TaxID=865 RepID=UPI0018C6AB89|nr:type II secretion system F family protein [Pectinatus frisingensis]